jgi:asparagine synthase (glutamine-hydrolysing)
MRASGCQPSRFVFKTLFPGVVPSMCGIAGVVSRTRLTEAAVQTARSMQSALVHRGPDSSGSFEDDHVALRMSRLKILDISGSEQPLSDETGNIMMIFNGEIYNYIELREMLRREGYVFQTNGDGETLIHLFRARGFRFLENVRGMFAFAMWIRDSRRLILGRDRLGEKPLYLYEDGDSIYFASEMKAIVCSVRYELKLDALATHAFFHHNFVPEPATLFQQIRKLPAGHLLDISIDPWTPRQRAYWSFERIPPRRDGTDRLLRDTLKEAVALTMRSDVPVGIALSGGLDSGALAKFAVDGGRKDLTAISVGYTPDSEDARETDERAAAAELASHLGIPVLDVEIDGEEVTRNFAALIAATDDPVADIAGFAYWAIAREARSHGIPVLLFGQGGDELFGGYAWVREAHRRALLRYRWETGWWLGPASRLRMGRAANDFGNREQAKVEAEEDGEYLKFFEFTRDFRRAKAAMRSLYDPRFLQCLDGSHAGDVRDPLSLRGRMPEPGVLMAQWISATYLVGNGIVQVDRLGMEQSIETRLPFLDVGFVELAVGMRKAAKADSPFGKESFKRILEAELPRWFLDRPKRGFRPPASQWLKSIGQAFGHRLRDGRLVQLGVLSPQGAADLAACRPEPDSVMPIYYKAIILELWLDHMERIAHRPVKIAA